MSTDLSSSNDARVADILAEFMLTGRRQQIERVLAQRTRSITLVLENIHDPHNGSASLRSAEAFGIQQVHVIEENEPFVIKHKITRGSHKWIDIFRYPTATECAESLHGSGYQIWVADPSAPNSIDDIDFSKNIALVLGNEFDGVSSRMIALGDNSFRIPMHGFVESLNVSVSAALILFTAVNRRRFLTGRIGDLTEQERNELRDHWYKKDVRASEQILARRGIS